MINVNYSTQRPIFRIAVVACGQRLRETLAMIKSALLFNHYHDRLYFIIFAEDHLITSFSEKLGDWQTLLPEEFGYQILPLQFPPNNSEWKTLFKPCAAQRLFLPVNYDNKELFVDVLANLFNSLYFNQLKVSCMWIRTLYFCHLLLMCGIFSKNLMEAK